MERDWQQTGKILIEEAKLAREQSYSPYSGFSVGAALLTAQGKIYRGCNVENASFGATVCAERTAAVKAVSEGEREFVAIAVVGGKGSLRKRCTPCGICRQFLFEWGNPETFRVFLGDGQQEPECYSLRELLPLSFGDLEKN